MADRRTFVQALVIGWIAEPLAGRGEPTTASGRTVRVGYLTAGPGRANNEFTEAEEIFFDRLRELGWVRGRNLVIEIRRSDGDAKRLQPLVSELLQQRVDIIVTTGTTAVRAARDTTQSIPIVMAGAGDPVASGLIKSLARPGGNVTGISLMAQEILPKALSLLVEIVPRARRVDLLANAANPANAVFARMTDEAGHSLGVETRLLEVRTPEELEPAIAGTRADALMALADPMFSAHLQRMADAGVRRRIPIGSTGGPNYVKAGMLMSYTVNVPELARRAAEYADRILKGANPAEMPVEQPTHYQFALNLRTARLLGLPVPQRVLLRADEVIQ